MGDVYTNLAEGNNLSHLSDVTVGYMMFAHPGDIILYIAVPGIEEDSLAPVVGMKP